MVNNVNFSGMGNVSLLSGTSLKPVKCSRSLSDDHISIIVTQALHDAEAGTVHVSPFISNGERRVRDALVEAGYPIILLVENGLTSFSKPSGKLFDACANGKLLILAPWEHHTQKVCNLRERFLALNELAVRISSTSAM